MIMHDATTPIVERIEYATEVQVALDFSEARRELRDQPRQSYSYTLLERTKSTGINWWRARELTDFKVPWLPSAVCRGAPVPAELRDEYPTRSPVYAITENAVDIGVVLSYSPSGIPSISLPTGFPSGGFIAPAVDGRVLVSDASYTGSLIRGATIEVFRKSPVRIGAPMDWNTFSPDGATDITESIAYRMAQLDFTGSTLDFRDFYSVRPRMAHSYSYVFGRMAAVSKYRSFFMGRQGRLLGVYRARSWVPGMTISSVSNEGLIVVTYTFHVSSPVRPNVFVVKERNPITGLIEEVVIIGESVVASGIGEWVVEWTSRSRSHAFLIDDCPYILTDRRIDQDVLEITHIAPGVATSTLTMVDL